MANNKDKDLNDEDFFGDENAENINYEEEEDITTAEYDTDDEGTGDYPDILSVTKTFLNIDPDKEK